MGSRFSAASGHRSCQFDQKSDACLSESHTSGSGSNPPSVLIRRTGVVLRRTIHQAGRSKPMNDYKPFCAILGWVEDPHPTIGILSEQNITWKLVCQDKSMHNMLCALKSRCIDPITAKTAEEECFTINPLPKALPGIFHSTDLKTLPNTRSNLPFLRWTPVLNLPLFPVMLYK